MAEKGAGSEDEGKRKSPDTKGETPVLAEDELDSLLDDALKDFSKPEIIGSSSGAKSEDVKDSSSKNHPEGQHALQEEDFNGLFTEEGLAKMTEELSKAFSDLPNMNLDLLGSMSSSSCAQSSTGEGIQLEHSLEENLENAWKSMTKNLKDTKEEKSDDFLDRELMNAMKGFGLDNAEASPENLMSMMQGMMTNLLSKDILYPSLKEIQIRYPSWLEENKSKLSDEEYTRFTRQQELVSRICLEFESEKEDDDDAVKKARTEKIMELMQHMEKYGQPPMDILGQMESEGYSGPERLNFDSSEQCVCM